MDVIVGSPEDILISDWVGSEGIQWIENFTRRDISLVPKFGRHYSIKIHDILPKINKKTIPELVDPDRIYATTRDSGEIREIKSIFEIDPIYELPITGWNLVFYHCRPCIRKLILCDFGFIGPRINVRKLRIEPYQYFHLYGSLYYFDAEKHIVFKIDA